MPEKGELQVLPLVITPCDLGTKLARPVVLKYQALDWQTISFDVPREKLIILGLSVVGIAGLYVLVRRGKFPLPSLRQYLPSRQPKDATQPTAAKLGHCKFGFQDV
jgi:hypothetical protein